jgi:Leucine-rich repeat (LRR) protein
LRHLNLQANEITKIENLVSLPNLNHMDLSFNRIAEINPFITEGNSLQHLRVLILNRNIITEIKNLDSFQHLNVLDLHENKIKEISGIEKLASLRILNLSANLIEGSVLFAKSTFKQLVEINLKRNKITSV